MAIGKLLDWSQARPPLAKVKAAGYSTAYRYVCSDAAERGLPGKRLTPTERDAILHAGLDIGLHGEDQAGAAQKGYPRGLEQGKQWADYAHTVLGAPKGMTIVAAIDYDTNGTYPTVVRDYLHGVTDGLDGQYRTGVYGSIYVVDAALAEKTAVHGVQTNAWSHGKISTWAHVYQHGPSEFPGTDYNDVLRVPHGTWLQTLGGIDMLADERAWLKEVRDFVVSIPVASGQLNRGDTIGKVLPAVQDLHNDIGNVLGLTGALKTQVLAAIAAQQTALEADISTIVAGGGDPQAIAGAVVDLVRDRLAS